MALPAHFTLHHEAETLDAPPVVVLQPSAALAFRLTTREATDLGKALIQEARKAHGGREP